MTNPTVAVGRSDRTVGSYNRALGCGFLATCARAREHRAMQTLPYVVLVIIAGAAIAFQSPINASLGRIVGPFNSAFVSFAVGVVVTFIVANLTDGMGRLQGITSAQPWQFVGGLLGVVLVTALIIAVPRIGVSQMMVAALAGQLAAAMLIDHYGWLGVETRTFGWKRGLAIPLLGVAVWLIRQPS